MREFFKDQLKALHRTTGLQQYYKLQELKDWEEQFKLLLDELVAVCNLFPLIPEKDKRAIIDQSILSDPEFIGFNKKIVWKWLNIHNSKYIQSHSQSQFVEIDREPAPPDVADKYLEEWRIALAKIGNHEPRPDGIKDQRIQKMKDDFQKIKCNHPLWIETGDNEWRCNSCGVFKSKEQNR